jgi:hypothetical protein
MRCLKCQKNEVEHRHDVLCEVCWSLAQERYHGRSQRVRIDGSRGSKREVFRPRESQNYGRGENNRRG